jgi:thiol-disulfide isomerase/thioredoxin
MNGNTMKKINLAFGIALLSCLALTACDRPAAQEQGEALETAKVIPTAEAEAEAKSEKQEIEWFAGGIGEAFSLARAQNKPLFLYWGAVWCPPCVEIKQTVFKSQQFIAQSKLFIPVYLDGDTERAQVYGEKFDAKVYPTMIVFNPAGEEVTRLHAGIDISAYNTVLELSLDNMRPTLALVEAALQDPESLTNAELQQLAYYSWYDSKALPEGTPPELFNTLSTVAADRIPEASARFYLQFLEMLAEVLEGDNAEAVDKADSEKLRAILTSPELLLASWDYLILPEGIISAVGGDDTAIESLQNQWAAAMRDNRHNERLSTKNQLYGWRPYLVFHFQGDEDKTRPLPQDVAAAIRTDGKAADESVAGTHERQSVINTVSNVYVLAGLKDEARALLTAEIEESKTPYYFMGSLAELEEQEGNPAEALEWRRRAYEASKGPATRIRWWASYVQALTRLAPDDAQHILQASMEIFDTSNGMEEFFSGANFRNLGRANTSLQEWNRDHYSELSALDDYHASLQGLCELQPPDSPEHARCTSLLEPATS